MSEFEFFIDDFSSKKKKEVKKPSGSKDIETFIDGEYIVRDGLQVFLHQKVIPFDDSSKLIGTIPTIPNWLYSYAKIYKKASAEEIIFIDTETTGLDRGANTYAFLTGVCYYREGNWYLKQYFIQDPTQEKLLVILLEELLAEFKLIVSYNGKSYDIPLLDNRFKYHRSSYSIRTLESLDLMHLSRRFWKDSLHGCKLKDVELMVLGFVRDYINDIPGELIPATYFSYLESQNGEEIANVFYHNEIDIFSMTGIIRVCANIDFKDGDYYTKYKIDATAIGKLMLELQYDREGYLALKYSLNDNPKNERSVLLMVNYLKRYDDYEEAVTLLENITDFSIKGCLELAMILEHKIKDIPKAHKYAKYGYLMLYNAIPLEVKLIKDAEKRLKRLTKKLEKRNTFPRI